METNNQDKKYLEFNGLKIDPIIFTQGFVPGCELGICGGQCCDKGVYIDKNYVNVILNYKDIIIESMEDEQEKNPERWFDNIIEKDNDFPSGYATGTNVYKDKNGNEKCVFKDSVGRCTIQFASVKNGMHKWAIKPKYCIMYPITVIDNVLTYDNDHSNDLNYCGINKEENFSQSVFEATREEIKYIFGEELYNFLNDHYEKNYKDKVKFNSQKIYQIQI